MITAVDLFCGVGGLTHGLIKGGISVAAGIDVDPNFCFPYETNNSAKYIEKDIRELKAAELNNLFAKDNLRLLAGCAPCQPFSIYSRSKRESRTSDDWQLSLEFGRLIQEVQPELVTMENVPQFFSHPIFKRFLQFLEGYTVWHSVIDCSAFGIPQTRKRLVLLASKLGEKELQIASENKKGPTVRNAIGSLPPVAAGSKNSSDYLHVAPSLRPINLKRIRASKPGGTWRDWPVELLADCHRKKSGANYSSVYGRMEWDKPAPTITTQCFGYGNGRFGHPEQDRALTLREAAILQTFPKNYRFVKDMKDIKFHTLGKMIGNAVPVKLGVVIAKTFINHVKAYETPTT